MKYPIYIKTENNKQKNKILNMTMCKGIHYIIFMYQVNNIETVEIKILSLFVV